MTEQIYLNYVSGDRVTETVVQSIGHEKVALSIARSLTSSRQAGNPKHTGHVTVDHVTFTWTTSRTPFDFGEFTWWVFVELAHAHDRH